MTRRIMIVGFLVLLSTSCWGQVNSIRLSVRNYLSYSQDILIVSDSLSLIPSTANNRTRSYDFSLIYYRKIGNVNFYFGGGLNKGINSLNRENKIGSGNKRVESNERIESGFHLNFGTSTWANIISPKVFFALNSGLYFRLNYEENTDFTEEIFDGNTYLEGRQVIINYNDDVTIGLNIELSLYYEIFDEFFIGLNHNSLFFVNLENGITELNAFQYDVNRSVLLSSNQRHKVKQTTYSKSHLFSVSILKKF